MKQWQDWFSKSLKHKLGLGLAAILVLASLTFLALFTSLYRSQIQAERSAMSMQVNLLLQVSLENAMLKRDLPGLRNIVDKVGDQDTILKIMIINPDREVRFSSDKKMLGKTLSAKNSLDCKGCASSQKHFSDKEKPALFQKGKPKPKASTRFMTDAAGREILRSVNPVYNKAGCTGCHGPLDKNIVNGILIVDYDGSAIRNRVMSGVLFLSAAGGFIVLLTLGAAWFFLSRHVLTPLNTLIETSHTIASGNLSRRVHFKSTDEFGELGESFDNMADRLESLMTELKERDSFMQDLVNAVPDGIRLIDEDYRIVLANKSYYSQLKIPQKPETENGLHQQNPDLCYVSSHHRKEPCQPTLVTCPLHEMKKGETPLKTLHHHKCRYKGCDLAVEISADTLVTTRNGVKQRYVVEVIRDLKQQVKVSQQQRMSELGQLAAGVAHEIHNPLASVKMALQAILKMKNGSCNKEVTSYLEQVDGEIDKSIEITKRLLTLSMLPSDYIQLVSLTSIIPEVLSLLRYEAEKLHITLKTDLEEGLRVLATDSEVRMLTLNLTQNAFHAMPQGGTLVIEGKIEDGQVIVSFTDNGTGIAPDIADHIFSPFFSRRSNNTMGTGLGLTISKAVTDRYKGDISVQSSAEKGTCFKVSFPLADHS